LLFHTFFDIINTDNKKPTKIILFINFGGIMKTKRLFASLVAVVAALSLSVTANAAGTTSDDEILPEAPTTEAVETLPAEAPATEAPVTEAPVAPAPNPTTGNAPIALAVVPVAIAAAAIVAKKARK
jgi:hypothetical protein